MTPENRSERRTHRMLAKINTDGNETLTNIKNRKIAALKCSQFFFIPYVSTHTHRATHRAMPEAADLSRKVSRRSSIGAGELSSRTVSTGVGRQSLSLEEVEEILQTLRDKVTIPLIIVGFFISIILILQLVGGFYDLSLDLSLNNGINVSHAIVKLGLFFATCAVAFKRRNKKDVTRSVSLFILVIMGTFV